MPFDIFAQVNNPRICIFFIRAPVNGKRRNESVAFVNADKALENKQTVVDDVCGVDEAKRIIDYAINNYVDKFCK